MVLCLSLNPVSWYTTVQKIALKEASSGRMTFALTCSQQNPFFIVPSVIAQSFSVQLCKFVHQCPVQRCLLLRFHCFRVFVCVEVQYGYEQLRCGIHTRASKANTDPQQAFDGDN